MFKGRKLRLFAMSAAVTIGFSFLFASSASAAVTQIDKRVQYWHVANKKEINMFADPFFDFYMDTSHVSSGFEGNYGQVSDGKYSSYMGLPVAVGTERIYSKVGVFPYQDYYTETYPNYLEMKRNLNVNGRAFVASNMDEGTVLTYSARMAYGQYDMADDGQMIPLVPGSDGLRDVDDYDYFFPVDPLNPLAITVEYHSRGSSSTVLQVDLYDENKQLIEKGAVPRGIDGSIPTWSVMRATPAKDGSNTYYDGLSFSDIGDISGNVKSSGSSPFNAPSCGSTSADDFGATYLPGSGLRLGDGQCAYGTGQDRVGMLGQYGQSYLVYFQPNQYHPATKYIQVNFINSVSSFGGVQTMTGLGIYNMKPTLHTDGSYYFGPDPDFSNVGGDKDYSNAEPEETSLILEIVKEIVDFLFLPPEGFIEDQIRGMLFSVQTAIGADNLVAEMQALADGTPVKPVLPVFSIQGMELDLNEIINFDIYDENRHIFEAFLKGVVYFAILLGTLNNIGRLFGISFFNTAGMLMGNVTSNPEKKKSGKSKEED